MESSDTKQNAVKVTPRNRPVVILPADIWSDHPSQNLTPSQAYGYLETAERGDIKAQCELYQDILEKDPTISSVLETRQLAVQTFPWDIVAIDPDDPDAKAQAVRMKKQLRKIGLRYAIRSDSLQYATFDEFLHFISSATAYGFAAAQILWDIRTSTIDAFVPFEHRHFAWGDISKQGTVDFNPYELRVKTIDAPVFGEPIQPYEFALHAVRGDAVAPGRRGALRKLVNWWIFKNFAVKSMLRYGERTGEPIRIGYYDGQNADDYAVIKRAVRDLGTDAAAVISNSAKIDFVGHDRSTGNDIHTRIIDAVNSEISKLVLGHQATTESVPGKLGNDDQKLEVQQYRIEADAVAEAHTVNNQIIAPMAIFRDGRVLCRYERKFQPEEDEDAKLSRVERVAKLVPVPAGYVYETAGIPKPEGEEDVTALESKSLFSQRLKVERRASRVKAAKMAQERLNLDAGEYAQEASAVADALFNGLKVGQSSKDMRRIIEGNKTAFRSSYEKLLRRAIGHAAALVPEGVESTEAKNDIAFNLKNDRVTKYLDWHAFTLSVIEGEKITRSAFEVMDQELRYAAENGLTIEGFKANVAQRIGVGKTANGHMENVFRTNMATAHSAGKLFALEKAGDTVGGWEYIAIIDDRTRDDHKELDGKMFAANDTRYFPPIGFQCRCIASLIDAAEWEAEGYEPDKPKVDVDEKFQNRAVEGYQNWVDDMKKEYPDITEPINNYEERVT